MRRWVEIERDGRMIGTFVDDAPAPARSALPLPYIISDEMPPTEQVDGRFYTSKSQFRAVGKSLGLIEVGNSQVNPRKSRDIEKEKRKRDRRNALGKAVAEYKMGRRPKQQRP